MTYPAPHGADVATLRDGESARFGRGAECEIRFGYAPIPDQGVPRVAGNLPRDKSTGLRRKRGPTWASHAQIRGPSGTTQIPAGEGFSPRDSHFDLFVRGENSAWKLAVRIRTSNQPAAAESSTDPPTKRLSLELTEKQHAVLAAIQPPNRGRSEPATHKEVAAALNSDPNTVRESLYEIWALMFELQVPMPDVSDKRIAVVGAARLHGLLWNQD